MQKIFTPKLVITLLITALCIYLTIPTARYFLYVSGMDNPPTAEQEARRNEMLANPNLIKLGLDLQGGVDFLLRVDSDRLSRRDVENEAERLRSALADNQVDASVHAVTNDPAALKVTVTLNNAEDLDFAVTPIQDLLAGDFTLTTDRNRIRAALQGGELVLVPDQVKQSERGRVALESALKVVRRRVDEFGLTQPIVTKAGDDRITVQIPGETNPARIRESLLRTASLEFRLLHRDHDKVVQDFVQPGTQGVGGTGTGRIREEFLEITPNPQNPSKPFKQLKRNVPGVPAGYVLRLGFHQEIDSATGQIIPGSAVDDLVYVVSADAPLTGENLRRAVVTTDPTDIRNPIKVAMEFDSAGGRKFGDITTANVEHRFAIILDDVVYTAPRINEPITNGSAVISGGFTQAEASDLATTLRAGALPAPLEIVSENSVGPSLGADSIRDSSKALLIGGIFIIVMMVTIYSTAGVVAVMAMFINVLLIMAMLSLMGATLTLSGIGGILLTMGMAVDANILIYERLREELANGKPLRAAINIAFDRAFSVIVDSNITSLLPAMVLVMFEVVEGSVKGFWLAIGIGLLANLFTATVVTRAFLEAWYAKFRTISVGRFRLLNNVKIEWMRYWAAGFIISGALTGISIIYLLTAGFGFGIDFTGGVRGVVAIDGAQPPREELVRLLDQHYDDVRVVKIMNKDQWQFTVPQSVNKETGVAPTLVEMKDDITKTFSERFGPSASIEEFQSIDPFVGDEFKVMAIWTMVIACIIILGYVALRFQFVFAIGAVAALVHDVFLSMAVFRLFGHSITLDIVSALLIILGYSVNDTIVVFDRIRETIHEHQGLKLNELINRAINETLSRTILTGGTTLIAIGVMYLFGGAGLSDFALILLLGVLFGTYSSIFIASVIVYVMLRSRGIHTASALRKATARVAVAKVTGPGGKR